MNFTTKVPIDKYQNPIDYSSKIVSIGSCFAENMQEKFSYFKFQITTNPFGIIFNPVSIEKVISRIVLQELYLEKDIFFHNERWHCHEVHSDTSNENKEEFLQHLNDILHSTQERITNASHIIITFGTSWVYRNKTSHEVVANCHKMPQIQFDKEILSIEIIEKSILNTIGLIQKINANCHFIFTISPVRHLKDGFIENQRSKAHLISAIHNLQLAILNSHYFPSYEIMMDELRDYRFYCQDMLHPNQIAIDYIWINFFENYISSNDFKIMEEVCSIQKALSHRAFNVNSINHQTFLKTIDIKIIKLQEKYPFMLFN